jgi:formylglycine-generating enzyme required for sulfatase activity
MTLLIVLTVTVAHAEKANLSKEQKRSEIKDTTYDIVLIDIPSGVLKIEKSYENPAMVVSMESFYMAKYEVTQKLWKEVMGRHPFEFKGDDLPVHNVTWHKAQEFVKKLTKKTGYIYRLPSKLEWEYACRAGTTTAYYFGKDISDINEYEWWQNNSQGKPHPVGQKKPNQWGLYDMAGNVNEWTATYWDPEPFYRTHPKDGRVFHGIYRIVKGSSFLHGRDVHFRSDYGHAYSQYQPRKYLGFRIVREK